jgi:hypothetical protein
VSRPSAATQDQASKMAKQKAGATVESKDLVVESKEGGAGNTAGLPCSSHVSRVSIKHESTSSPPGEPMTMTLRSGVVAQAQLSHIAALWPKMLPILREVDSSQQSRIANIFHDWIHPGFHERNTPIEYQNESRSYAKQMMIELLDAFAGNWTMHHHLHNYADKLGLQAKMKIDPIAEIIYPPRDFSDWENEERHRRAAADMLASELSGKDPTKVANILTKIEEQARAANISYPSWGGHVCCRISYFTPMGLRRGRLLFSQSLK